MWLNEMKIRSWLKEEILEVNLGCNANFEVYIRLLSDMSKLDETEAQLRTFKENIYVN